MNIELYVWAYENSILYESQNCEKVLVGSNSLESYASWIRYLDIIDIDIIVEGLVEY